MNLTDLANHICEQCGMSDTDDVSAAKMFLQRRLEMIWNSQLWRSSLIEAVLTVNPDGTTTLADTVWIPSRSTLLLPTAFQSVLAVRADKHAMSVASLESYYRTDTDWLNMQGDPFEFQVLSAAYYEFTTAQEIYLLATNAADVNVPVLVKYSPDGVAILTATVSPQAAKNVPFVSVMGSDIGNALRIISVSKALTQGTLSVQSITRYPDYAVGVNDTGLALGSFVRNPVDGNYYQLTAYSVGVTYPAPGANAYWTLVQPQVETPPIPASAGAVPVRQRIRLTTQPQLSVNLRVLGKSACPVLGDYDALPINNAEPALMAFARGDMLLRSRQNGKAQIASQEGGTLLAALAQSEAFQQASSFRIVPDNGFGCDDQLSRPNSLNPLG